MSDLVLEGLLVSVNYADYLEETLPRNRDFFNRLVVVTTADDAATHSVSKKFDAEVVLSNRFYENDAKFNKAKGLNDGRVQLTNQGWVAVLDADIILPRDFRTSVSSLPEDSTMIYGLKRGLVRHNETLQQVDIDQLVPPISLSRPGVGYLQLFRAVCQQWQTGFNERFTTAAKYDVDFLERWPAEQRSTISGLCLHVGISGKNWEGRVTPPWTLASNGMKL